MQAPITINLVPNERSHRALSDKSVWNGFYSFSDVTNALRRPKSQYYVLAAITDIIVNNSYNNYLSPIRFYMIVTIIKLHI